MDGDNIDSQPPPQSRSSQYWAIASSFTAIASSSSWDCCHVSCHSKTRGFAFNLGSEIELGCAMSGSKKRSLGHFKVNYF